MDKINDATIKIANLNEIIKTERLIAKTGDVNGRDLYIQLEDKVGKGINTADARLTLAYKTPSGIINEIPFVPINVEEGLYGLTYDSGLTHEAGVVTATIRLKTYDTTTETPNFEIYVEGSPLEGIHFSEVDGLTFKKVMDKVDSIDFRAGLIEEDILKIDEQLQDMNTRIVYVEEDDSIDERVYNNENDIQLLGQEIERLDTELADLRLEVDNIEVGTGGGGGTGELDTGWRVVLEKGYRSAEAYLEVYVRRVGNVVEMQGKISSWENHTTPTGYRDTRVGYDKPWGNRKHHGFPEMFRLSEGDEVYVANTNVVRKGGGSHDTKFTAGSEVALVEDVLYVKIGGDVVGNFNCRYITARPFTDEYMDLPLADFT